MDSAVPGIRRAHVEDAAALSVLAERTFRATFSAANTIDNINLHCESSYSETAQTREIVDPAILTSLAEAEDELVGFAQVRWRRAPSCVGAEQPGEIHRLYVADEWHAKGVAQELMKACITEMQLRGTNVIWLGVWERNPRAISFYKKFGFVEVGEHTFKLGNDPQRDVIMALHM